MKMRLSKLRWEDINPTLSLCGRVFVSRKGSLTVGWELSLPAMCTRSEKDYDGLLDDLASAIRLLPEWTVVHRQEMYFYDSFHEQREPRSFLDEGYNGNFEGRQYLKNTSYLFLTFATHNLIEKGSSASGLFGIKVSVKVPDPSSFRDFLSKADEFIAVFTKSGLVKARPLYEEDYRGVDGHGGIIERYAMLNNSDGILSDILVCPDGISVGDKIAVAYEVGESDQLPGEIASCRDAGLGANSESIRLSYASPIGVQLDCEHCVNQYIVVPSQAELLAKLEKEKKKMIGGINSVDNRLNAEEIELFLETVYREGLMAVKTHMDIIAWGPLEDQNTIREKISAAVTTMKVTAKFCTFDAPLVWYAGIPGNGCEIGNDNMMAMELASSLVLTPFESFERGFDGGNFRLTDRNRHIPLPFDFQRLARSKGLIDNYNTFVLGGSGSGKSFFMNSYLRSCYDEGESIFVIDVGDSYEGLSGIIREQSGGKDGSYLSWGKDMSLSFSILGGASKWLNEDGTLNFDGGAGFFMTVIRVIWTPDGGWTDNEKNILSSIVLDFLKSFGGNIPDDLIFDDFYRYVDTAILPRINNAATLSSEQRATSAPKGQEEEAPKRRTTRRKTAKTPAADELYYIGNVLVTPEIFNVNKFSLALRGYSLDGNHPELFNAPAQEVINSRFVVVEVDGLGKDDPNYYSLCILMIMRTFDNRMRTTPGFKLLVIEEAWSAIDNPEMATYLKSIWKTARKFSTAAVVVTQEPADIINSQIIKTAILDNSAVKILLDQSNHIEAFPQIRDMLSLSTMDGDLALTVNKKIDPRYSYKEVFVSLGGKYSFVAATEVSMEEALAFESDKELKKLLLYRAKTSGSIVGAIRDIKPELLKRMRGGEKMVNALKALVSEAQKEMEENQ